MSPRTFWTSSVLVAWEEICQDVRYVHANYMYILFLFPPQTTIIIAPHLHQVVHMRPSKRFLWPTAALGRDGQPIALSLPQPWDMCEDRPQFPSLFGQCVGSSPTPLLVYIWRWQEKSPTACLPNDAVIWIEACVEHKGSMILLEVFF